MKTSATPCTDRIRKSLGGIRLARREIPFRALVFALAPLLLAVSESGFAQGPLPPVLAPGPPSPSRPISPPGAIREEDLLKTPLRPHAVPLHTIVIDPGHGGWDAGVRGASGLLEKDVVLKVARKLDALIQERMGIRVLLTRTGDSALPLLERTAIANNAKGQLFISLHAEGDFRREAEGPRVFLMEPSGPPKEGAPPPEGNERLRAILWDIAQTAHLNESGRLARLIADALARETGRRAAPARSLELLVLRGAQMPAVLVSVAHLTNPQEESLLESDEFLDKVARALYEAVLNFAEGKDAPS